MGRISQRSRKRAEKEFNIYFKSMEKENKQTAVEWYDQQLHILDLRLKSGSITIGEYFTLKAELYNQAKAMEKDQIEEAYSIGYTNCKVGIKYREQYYNETFKK